MATLTLIGEPFPDRESAVHAAVAIELTEALAEVAPRGCGSRLLTTSSSEVPEFSSPRAAIELIPLKPKLLPVLWQSRVTARPLDGEFVHSLTPMVPLRRRGAEDDAQTSVNITHTLAWDAPELLGVAAARLYRAFVRRAVRLADVLVAPTHAVAKELQARFGETVPIQVLPLAAPTAYSAARDSVARRAELGLPSRYVVTTATPDAHGRLDWLLDAYAEHPELPPLVILTGYFPGSTAGLGAVAGAAQQPAEAAVLAASATEESEQEPQSESQPEAVQESGPAVATGSAIPAVSSGSAQLIPSALHDRVRVIAARELADVGAVLSGAQLLAMPHARVGAAFEVTGAIASSVPVLHSGSPVLAELVLDAGISANTPDVFADALARLLSDDTVAGEADAHGNAGTAMGRAGRGADVNSVASPNGDTSGGVGGDPDLGAGTASHDSELARLRILADDRGRSYSWESTAWQLWEIHASL